MCIENEYKGDRQYQLETDNDKWYWRAQIHMRALKKRSTTSARACHTGNECQNQQQQKTNLKNVRVPGIWNIFFLRCFIPALCQYY
jgi:hypothetical protein